MKKRIGALLLGSLLMLTGCGADDNGGSKAEEDLTPSSFKERFNASMEGRIGAGAADSQNILVSIDFAADHVTYASEGYQEFYFEKASNGGVKQKSLNIDNEIVTKTLTGVLFDERFANPFANIEEESKTIELSIDGAFNDLGKSFYSALLGNWLPLSGEPSDITANLTFEGGAALEMTCSFLDVACSFSFAFLAPSNYSEKRIASLPESEESQKLAETFDKIKEGNYTYRVYCNEDAYGTYKVDKNKFLYTNKAGMETGYLKSDSGYKILEVKSDGKAYLKESKSATFSSLLPTFSFAPELIRGGALANIANPLTAQVIDSLAIKGLSFSSEAILSRIAWNEGDYLEIGVSDGKKEYEIDIEEIGKTAITPDLENYIEDGWAIKEPTIYSDLLALLGEDMKIPYFDIGGTWNIDNFQNTAEVKMLSLSSDSFDDENEGLATLKEYVKKLRSISSFSEFNEDDWADYAPYPSGGGYGSENDFAFHINEQFYLEAAYADDYFSGYAFYFLVEAK